MHKPSRPLRLTSLLFILFSVCSLALAAGDPKITPFATKLDRIPVESYSVITFKGDGTIDPPGVEKAVACITCIGKKTGGKFVTLELWFSASGATLHSPEFDEDASHMAGRLYYGEGVLGGMLQILACKSPSITVGTPKSFWGISASGR